MTHANLNSRFLRPLLIILLVSIGLPVPPINAQENPAHKEEKEAVVSMAKTCFSLFIRGDEEALNYIADPYQELDGEKSKLSRNELKELLQEIRKEATEAGDLDKDFGHFYDTENVAIYSYEEAVNHFGADEIGEDMQPGDYVVIYPPRDGVTFKAVGGVFRKIEGEWKLAAGS